MKRISTIILALVILTGAFAQNQGLKPSLIVWQAGAENFSLRKALYGVNQPDKLTLKVYFSQADLAAYKNKNLKLEFRWYYYLSTRRKFVKSDIVPLSQAKVTKDGAVIFSSTLSTVQPGWWEVQIINSADRSFVTFAGLNRFQILIRRPVYVRR